MRITREFDPHERHEIEVQFEKQATRIASSGGIETVGADGH
jgi:putative transposon-encoded protein